MGASWLPSHHVLFRREGWRVPKCEVKAKLRWSVRCGQGQSRRLTYAIVIRAQCFQFDERPA